jgi:hypothetical protein
MVASPRIFPLHCPHCGQALPSPVAKAALDAARTLLALGGRGSSAEVAQQMGVSRRYAAQLLGRAERAGLVARDGRVQRAGSGQRAIMYAANAGVVAAYE